MTNKDTDFTIRINGEATLTMLVEDDDYFDYFCVPDTARDLTVNILELVEPDGTLAVRFDFADGFTIPRGERGLLSVARDRNKWFMKYFPSDHVADDRHDFYSWDPDRRQLRAADFHGEARHIIFQS